MGFLGITGSDNVGLDAIGGSLADMAESAVGNVIDAITGDTTFKKLYKQDESSVKQYTDQPADLRKWHTLQTDITTSDYAFLLKAYGKIIQVPFNINPQSEEISEPIATTITPLQGGGKLTNSDGMVMKDIVIRGKCGLYPNQHRKRLPDSGVGSGYEAFKNLQNVFRRYAFLKRFGDYGNVIQLIYVNRRSQEAWVVEPKTFTSSDTVDSNFNKTYNIVLETISPYNGKEMKGLVENLLSSIPLYNEIDQVMQRFSEVVDEINASIGQITAIVGSFKTTIMTKVNALLTSFSQLKNGDFPNLAGFKRESIKSMSSQVRVAQRELEKAGDKESAHKLARLERSLNSILLQDDLFDTTPTSANKTLSDSINTASTTFRGPNGESISSQDAINAGVPATRPSVQNIISNGEVNKVAGSASSQSISEESSTETRSTVGGVSLTASDSYQINRYSASYGPEDAIPPSTSDLTSLVSWNRSWDESLKNIDPQSNDYLTAIVHHNDSIQTLAKRLLGDSGRWLELVILNRLSYPYVASSEYIATKKTKNIIAWGGVILYPRTKSTSGSRTHVWRTENAKSLSLSPLERGFGSDILIDKNTNDIIWGVNDFKVAYGIDAIEQFIRKRVLTKKGSLRRALGFGVSSMLGVSRGIDEVLLKAEISSLFDGVDRIASSTLIAYELIGGVLQLTISVVVKDVQDPVVISTRLE